MALTAQEKKRRDRLIARYMKQNPKLSAAGARKKAREALSKTRVKQAGKQTADKGLMETIGATVDATGIEKQAFGGRTKSHQNTKKAQQHEVVSEYAKNNDIPLSYTKGDDVYILNTGFNYNTAMQTPEGYEAKGKAKPGEYQKFEVRDTMTAGKIMKPLVTTALGAGVGSALSAAAGLSGIYAGATSGAANAATQGAIRGDLALDDVLKGAALGGVTAAGSDFIKDVVSEAVDPDTLQRATTSDLGGLVGEKGLFSGIPEVDITGVRNIADATGDFLFGPSTTQEWVQMADGTKVYPDPDTGLVTLPDGTVAPMNTIQNNISSFPSVQDTLMQEAGTGGLLSPIAPILDTAITPIADDLATAIVGSNPWHDERLTLEERLAAERSVDASSQSIYRELPKGTTGNYPAPSEEEQAASEPLVVGPQPSQEEAEEIVEDLLEGDEELILGPGAYEPSGTGETLPTGGGEEIVQGGEDLPSGGDDDTLPTGGDNFPNPDPETIFTSTEDPVGQTQALPPGGGGGGGGSAVAAERARAKLKEGDPELFRLARIMQVEGLPQSVYEAALGRINGILKGRQGSDYEGDVTREIDPLSGRYIQRVKGERGETRRRAMLRELKEKEMTT